MLEWTVLPGFRFLPRDEQLVGYYLRRKVAGQLTEAERAVIPEADLLRSEPWDLVPQTSEKSHECFAFWRRGRKYSPGCRANRCTANGYWKSTGSDRAVIADGQRIGMKKTLVFYVGRAPRGAKTDWVMHEFRLLDDEGRGTRRSLTEDSFVVCRVFQRRTQADERESLHSLLHHAEGTPQPSASPETSTSHPNHHPSTSPSTSTSHLNHHPLASPSSSTSLPHDEQITDPSLILASETQTEATSGNDLLVIPLAMNAEDTIPLEDWPVSALELQDNGKTMPLYYLGASDFISTFLL